MLQAIFVIQSSGYGVKAKGIRIKAPIAAKSDIGYVKLIAKAVAKRASYQWQMSNDISKTWVDLPISLQAKTIVKGLKEGSQLLFRVRGFLKDGPLPWTDPVRAVVQ